MIMCSLHQFMAPFSSPPIDTALSTYHDAPSRSNGSHSKTPDSPESYEKGLLIIHDSLNAWATRGKGDNNWF